MQGFVRNNFYTKILKNSHRNMAVFLLTIKIKKLMKNVKKILTKIKRHGIINNVE